MVTDYIQETFNDLSQHEIYACGNPAMIENLYNIASSQLKLDKRNFYSDVFTPSI
jgi:CDP-4-dehydro-6-deoxyglucose reductase